MHFTMLDDSYMARIVIYKKHKKLFYSMDLLMASHILTLLHDLAFHISWSPNVGLNMYLTD